MITSQKIQKVKITDFFKNLVHKKYRGLVVNIIRFLVQLIFFLVLPTLFGTVFGSLRALYSGLTSGFGSILEALLVLFPLIAVIPATALLGRFFCGWMCSYGFIMDIASYISRNIFRKKFKLSIKADKTLKVFKYIVLALYIALVWVLSLKFMNDISQWAVFGKLAVGGFGVFAQVIKTAPIGFALMLTSIGLSFFIERFFCRYMCPLGAVFAVISKLKIAKLFKPRTKCGSCTMCTKQCPMAINLTQTDAIKSGECIHCMQCVAVCPRANVTYYNKENSSDSKYRALYVVQNWEADVKTQATYKTSSQPLAQEAFTPPQKNSTPSQAPNKGMENAALVIEKEPAINKKGKFKEKGFKLTAAAVTIFALVFMTALTYTQEKVFSPMINNYLDEQLLKQIEDEINKEIDNEKPQEPENNEGGITDKPKYKDGVYRNQAYGYKSYVVVDVTIKDGKITAIKVVKHAEDLNPYMNNVLRRMPPQMIRNQTWEVDIVSGATKSAIALKEAVKLALQQALNSN